MNAIKSQLRASIPPHLLAACKMYDPDVVVRADIMKAHGCLLGPEKDWTLCIHNLESALAVARAQEPSERPECDIEHGSIATEEVFCSE